MPASGSGPSGGRTPVGARVCVQGPNVPQVTLVDWWLSASHNRNKHDKHTPTKLASRCPSWSSTRYASVALTVTRASTSIRRSGLRKPHGG